MIGFIGAMDEEINELLKLMDNYEKKIISNMDFYKGKLSGVDVIITKSGVGKVYAAMCTTILLENFDISGVVNIGTAGGLSHDEQVLDVVISDKVAHHDMDVSVFGWPLGFEQDKTCYKANDDYIKIMKKIIEKEDRVFIGNIASGDSFIHRDDQIDLINKNFPNALCAEMEAAGVAQVCKHYDIPFIVIRSLSDITVKEGNDLDFNTYVSLASKRSAVWCKKFIKEIKNQA